MKYKIFMIVLVLLCYGALIIAGRLDTGIETFGPVEVRAYTAYDAGNQWADGHVATNKIIQSTDYSVAVSRDIEKWAGGISNNKGMYVPGYNEVDEYSMINDRSDMKTNSVEVLMTTGDAHNRAMKWGVRKGVLKGMKTKAGFICWVEF